MHSKYKAVKFVINLHDSICSPQCSDDRGALKHREVQLRNINRLPDAGINTVSSAGRPNAAEAGDLQQALMTIPLRLRLYLISLLLLISLAKLLCLYFLHVSCQSVGSLTTCSNSYGLSMLGLYNVSIYIYFFFSCLDSTLSKGL